MIIIFFIVKKPIELVDSVKQFYKTRSQVTETASTPEEIKSNEILSTTNFNGRNPVRDVNDNIPNP